MFVVTPRKKVTQTSWEMKEGRVHVGSQLEVQSIVVRMLRQQKLKAAGHIVPDARAYSLPPLSVSALLPHFLLHSLRSHTTRAGRPSLMPLIKMIPHRPLTCQAILDLIKLTFEIIIHIDFFLLS